jgi:prepilin-type N-terminal cleavage/methylation domain-containing protein/prepilin-type processing-associated H-X9-DG protein
MRQRAFTLVELLVVISIIALLAAILLVVFGRSRQQAKMIACQANIHQLLLSLQGYDTEHQSLPYGFDMNRKGTPPGGYPGNMGFDTPGWWWFHYAGVIRNKSREGMKLLQCPSKRLDDTRLEDDLLCGNYGVNRSLCKSTWAPKSYCESFVGTPLSLGSLRRPGSTLLIVDSGYSLTCWWQAATESPAALGASTIDDTAYIPGLDLNKKRSLKPGQSYDAIGGRHPNKTVNVGFADGHAASEPASDLLVEKTKDGEYTNILLWQDQ